MNRENALKFLHDDCIFADSPSPSEAETLWLQHRHRVEGLPSGASRKTEILPMSQADVKAVRRFRSRYPEEHSIVDIVRLNPMELIVHQHWISPSLAEPYADSAAPGKWNQTALLDPPAPPPSKARREGDSIVFDLPHPEFLLTDRAGSEALLQLTQPIRFVTVGFHADRAVLLTGYHRVFALACHLMKMPDAPRGVLFAVSNALDLLGSDADELKAAMELPRPPRMADFFNSDLYANVGMPRRIYQMRVHCEISHRDVEAAHAQGSGEPIHDPGASRPAVRQGDARLQTYAEILRTQPNNKTAHLNFSVALLQSGRVPEAKAHGERAVFLDPANADAHCNLSAVLRAEGSIDAAKRHCRQALAIDPEHKAALMTLGQLYAVEGEFDHALTGFRQILARQPDCAETWLSLASIKTFSHSDPDLALLERLASGHRLAGKEAVYAHFALAKALEDCADFDRAFEHFRLGNECQKRLIKSDEEQSTGLFNAATRSFTRDTIERLAGGGNPTHRPIFVVGMPRSGTTLIEQILASHRDVYGGGELESLQDLLRTGINLCDPSAVAALDAARILQLADGYLKSVPSPPDRKRIVDKMPSNFLFAGLIHLMFPNAKIIHAVRDPLDTCLSCYAKLFGSGQSFSYDLAELGRYYTRYLELMDHWRAVLPAGCILDVCYEDLVSDFEPQVRRLLDFCKLDWDENCRMFHRTSRPVTTSSMAQVRQPLYDTSIGRWRRFEKHLGPLLAELKILKASRRALHSVGA